jgi:hypothetical protein
MPAPCRCRHLTTIIKTIWTDDDGAVTDVVAISIVIIMKGSRQNSDSKTRL